MSFLDTLLLTPAEWDRIWRRDASGALRYLPKSERHLDLAALRALDRAKPEKAEAAAPVVEALEEDEGSSAEGKEHGGKKEHPATCNAKKLNDFARRGTDQDFQAMMVNPALTLEHVIYIVERRSPGSTTLSLIARSRFSKNPTVLSWICRNPRTPIHLARKFLKRLPTNSVRVLARSPGTGRELKSAAQRLLAKRRKRKI